MLALLNAVGPADECLERLNQLPLGAAGSPAREALGHVVERVASAIPDTVLTLDAVENRGFEYHTGVTFTFFAPNVRGELGSGGRYRAGGGETDDADGEAATGFSLFMDTILRAIPLGERPSRVFVPRGTARAATQALRHEGWVTVMGLNGAADTAEAQRMNCTHILTATGVVPLGETGE